MLSISFDVLIDFIYIASLSINRLLVYRSVVSCLCSLLTVIYI